MRILNVIESKSGIIYNIESFVVHDDTEREPEPVTEARSRFIEIAKEHGCREEDCDECLDKGSYDNLDGYEVLLMQSNDVR